MRVLSIALTTAEEAGTLAVVRRVAVLFMLAACEQAFGVDPRPAITDGSTDGSTDVVGSPLACTSLRSLPTVLAPSGLVNAFNAGAVLTNPSATSVGLQQLVMFGFSSPTSAERLVYATAPTPADALVPPAKFARVSFNMPEIGTVWRGSDGRLALFHRSAAVTATATPDIDGLDGEWNGGGTVDIGAARKIRSVGVDGTRVIAEIDDPRTLVEYDRDPNTGELTEIDTLGVVSAAAGSPIHPSLSADGCRLFVELDTKKIAVAERRPDGVFGEPVEIVTDAQPAKWPALSEDGDFLYFVREPPGNARDELYLLKR